MKRITFSLVILFLLITLQFAILLPVEAVTTRALPNPLGESTTTITDLIKKIVEWIRDIAAPIATAMVLIGAFQMIFSNGNAESFQKGQKTILFTVIGYAIIWIGWGIVTIIQGILK